MSVVVEVVRLHQVHRARKASASAILTTGCTEPTRAAELAGVVTFYDGPEDDTIVAKYVIAGLRPGRHGMHVHESGGADCDAAGKHYKTPILNADGSVDDEAMAKQTHGGPLDRDGPRHRGALGNIVADASGVARGEVVANLSVAETIGRTLVVHADADDLGKGGTAESRENGTSGERLLGGRIFRMG